ncbi:MAG TPA: hypothetical protein VNI54_11130 [Thermoanaerobaculia bacterium]|nr:hypothetical protein [Thermoanaerobaculia bacterium]
MTRSLVPLVCALLVAVSAFALVETPAALIEITAVEAAAPAIVSDGENYFAAWTDHRDPRRPAVYGARITPEREVLDPVGIRLMEGSDPVSIASGLGHTFILGQSLRFVIVDRDANIVARGVVANESADRARVVFNGDDFIVFWSKDALRTATLDPFGDMVRWPDNVVSDRPVLLAGVASEGSRIVVAYSDVATLYVAATSPVGTPIWKDEAIATNFGWWTPASIAIADGRIAVAWVSREAEAQPWLDTVRTVVLDAAGNATGPSHIAIPWPATVRVVATDRGFRLFEQQELRVMSYALTNELVPAAVEPVVDVERPQNVRDFAVAAGPGGTMVVAAVGPVNAAAGESGLYAADGETPGAAVLVSRAGTTQSTPDVAIGDDGMLVAWHERERTGIRATFIASDGTGRTLDLPRNTASPAVAAQGAAYLIAWSTPAGTRARVLRDGGAFLGGEVLLSDIASSIVTVASDGRDFIVATAAAQRVMPIELFRIDSEGRVVARTSIPTTSQATVPRVRLACDDGECLLTWVEQKPLGTNCFNFRCTLVDQVFAVHLDGALTPRYASPVALTEPANMRIATLDAAAADGAYAVAWSSVDGISFARTVGRGQPLGTTVTLPGRHPALERGGSAWLLVREVGAELIAGQLTDDGFRGGTALARDAQWRSAPVLARRGSAGVIAYERTTIGEAAGGVGRVYVARLASIAPKRRSARN